MTPTTTIVSAATGTGLASALLAEASGEPWWIAAVVLPLAGFAALLVRWILQKWDDRDRLMLEREQRREVREEKRAEQSEIQTRAMQECVAELRRLNAQQEEQGRAIAAVPKRLADLLDERKKTA